MTCLDGRGTIPVSTWVKLTVISSVSRPLGLFVLRRTRLMKRKIPAFLDYWPSSRKRTPWDKGDSPKYPKTYCPELKLQTPIVEIFCWSQRNSKGEEQILWPEVEAKKQRDFVQNAKTMGLRRCLYRCFVSWVEVGPELSFGRFEIRGLSLGSGV